MPFSFPDNVPARIDDMPNEAQQIWITTFNTALKKNNEVQANKIAWAAVGKEFHPEGDEWVANKCQYRTMKVNKIETKPMYEDEYFKGFAITLTKEGVMNQGYKPGSEILRIPELVPKELQNALPVVIDHPDREDMTIQDKELGDGFIGNIRVEMVKVNEINKKSKSKREIPHIKGIDYVPKSRPKLIEQIETGNLTGTSIGYRMTPHFEDGEWPNEKGEMVRYNMIETNIRLLHNARLETQEPACSPADGCGYNDKKPADMTDDQLKATWVEITKGDE